MITYAANTTAVFDAWWSECDEGLQDAITVHVRLLTAEGPQLGRPYVDTLKGSSIVNLKELRVQYQGDPYRILFVFDPRREALLLLGGNKRSSKRWYRTAIRQAEELYARHLQDLEEQNGPTVQRID